MLNNLRLILEQMLVDSYDLIFMFAITILDITVAIKYRLHYFFNRPINLMLLVYTIVLLLILLK